MRRMTVIVLFLVLVGLGATTACSSSSGSSGSGSSYTGGSQYGSGSSTGGLGGATRTPAVTSTVAVGQVGYDANLCESRWDGSRWAPYGKWCFVQVGKQVFEAYDRNDPARTYVYRWDTSFLPKFFVFRYHTNEPTTEVWMSQPLGVANPYTEVLYNKQWIPLGDWQAIVAQQKAQATAAQQAEIARRQAESRQFAADMQQRAINMGKIWTAPDCTGSYNGCGY